MLKVFFTFAGSTKFDCLPQVSNTVWWRSKLQMHQHLFYWPWLPCGYDSNMLRFGLLIWLICGRLRQCLGCSYHFFTLAVRVVGYSSASSHVLLSTLGRHMARWAGLDIWLWKIWCVGVGQDVAGLIPIRGSRSLTDLTFSLLYRLTCFGPPRSISFSIFFLGYTVFISSHHFTLLLLVLLLILLIMYCSLPVVFHCRFNILLF